MKVIDPLRTYGRQRQPTSNEAGFVNGSPNYSGEKLTHSPKTNKMEESTSKNQYELAYHLMPEFDEKELAPKVAEIEKIITQNGGGVLKSQEPKKKHLSYPIKQKNYANFGVMEFEAPPENIESINAQMKMQTDILRYLLIQGYGEGKVLRSLTPSKRRARPAKLGEVVEPTSQPIRAKEESAKPEEIEKQLEEVLGEI